MKKLCCLVLLALIGVAAYWYVTQGRGRKDVRQAEREIAAGAQRLKDAVKETWPGLSLRTEDVKEELARSGKVVRQKARQASASIADAAADTGITTAIKAKLFADPELPALTISVNTTDGIVTLAGSVSSEEKIASAMSLALSVNGVREVISTLQVKRTQ